jgi:DNA-binding NtrC family response regulator
MNSHDSMPQAETALPGGSDVWVLIVDDEPGFRDTMRDILVEQGFLVEAVATGEQALEKLRERFFHAALIDVRLPDINGTELLVRLKERHPDTAAIMVTGYASLQTSIRATNAGAFAYIVKPLDIHHLHSLLQQALDRQRTVLEERRLLRQSRHRIQQLETREVQLSERVHQLEEELAAASGTARGDTGS